jgi:hypothetical protein
MVLKTFWCLPLGYAFFSTQISGQLAVTFYFVIVMIICEIVKMSCYLIFSGQISFKSLISKNW